MASRKSTDSTDPHTAGFPHTSLISYFLLSRRDRQTPAQSARSGSNTDADPESGAFPLNVYESDEDCDTLFGSDSECGDEERQFSFDIQDLGMLTFYTIVVIATVLNMDVFLSRMGARGVGDWFGERVHTAHQASFEHAPVHFCLQPQVGNVPAPRTWKYMESMTLDTCLTESLVFFFDSWDAGRLIAGNVLTAADKETGQLVDEVQTDSDTHASVDDTKGDDLAEEGKLTQIPPPRMHAGFGGPWE